MKKMLMEPSEFDNFIKSRLEEKSSLHIQQMESAKPFVWGAILNNLTNRKFITWYHLVAAVIVLLIGFSFLLFHMQNHYQSEMKILTSKLENIQLENKSQARELSNKINQVNSLESKLDGLENQLVHINQEVRLPESKIIIKTDTIYIRQVEYITESKNRDKSEEENREPQTLEKSQEDGINESAHVKDNVIFLTQNKKDNVTSSESVQIKFGTFVKED